MFSHGIVLNFLTCNIACDIIVLEGGEKMASVLKLIGKMERQPHGIRYEEARKVLEEYGYKVTSQKGSHRSFRNDEGDLLTIKEDTPTIKKHYVDKILSRINV